jgi:hypothetical protein
MLVQKARPRQAAACQPLVRTINNRLSNRSTINQDTGDRPTRPAVGLHEQQ